jgi:hypothetical protein
MTQKRLGVLGIVVYVVLRAVWTSLVVLAPAIGVWVASSLAAYRNGPVWLACAAGLLLFPVLPVLWDMAAEFLRRRRKQRRRDERVLTRWDRIVLRTLVLNLVFLGGLLWSRPEAAFTALSTRGDWFLEQVDHPLAEQARGRLLAAADGLQWLYEAAHDNQYADMVATGDKPSTTPEPAPTPSEWKDPFAREAAPQDTRVEPTVEAPVPVPEDSPPATPTSWPQPEALHPAILTMPAEARGSIEAVGRYLAEQEPAPARRVKAIHDFVATHLAYDADSYYGGRYPDQSAEAVFVSRLSVCAGYANLVKALADVTKDEVVVVVGDARGEAGEVDGEPHAWNAARIDGTWHLIDATWDSGHLKDKKFVREYGTHYLFVPPELIGITHFPEDPAWQLRAEPIGRGEFARLPMMRPEFFAEGLALEQPRRSQVTVLEDFPMQLGNPRKRFLMVEAVPAGGGVKVECTLTGRERVEVLCAGLSPGTYNVKIFSSPVEYGTYHMVGEVQVNATGE